MLLLLSDQSHVSLKQGRNGSFLLRASGYASSRPANNHEAKVKILPVLSHFTNFNRNGSSLHFTNITSVSRQKQTIVTFFNFRISAKNVTSSGN